MVAKVILGVFVAGAGWVWVGAFVDAVGQDRALREWPRVEGRVVRSEGRALRYVYEVGGRRYEGSRLRLGERVTVGPVTVANRPMTGAEVEETVRRLVGEGSGGSAGSRGRPAVSGGEAGGMRGRTVEGSRVEGGAGHATAVPRDTAPNSNAPGDTAPSGIAPGDAVQSGNAPGDAVLGSTGPSGTALGGTAPSGRAPGGTVPGGTGPGAVAEGGVAGQGGVGRWGDAGGEGGVGGRVQVAYEPARPEVAFIDAYRPRAPLLVMVVSGAVVAFLGSVFVGIRAGEGDVAVELGEGWVRIPPLTSMRAMALALSTGAAAGVVLGAVPGAYGVVNGEGETFWIPLIAMVGLGLAVWGAVYHVWRWKRVAYADVAIKGGSLRGEGGWTTPGSGGGGREGGEFEADEVGAGDVGGGENGTGESGTHENRAGENGTVENRTQENGAGKVGPGAIGRGDVGAGQSSAGENGAGENRTRENGAGRVGTGAIGRGDVGAGHSSVGENGTREISAGENRTRGGGVGGRVEVGRRAGEGDEAVWVGLGVPFAVRLEVRVKSGVVEGGEVELRREEKVTRGSGKDRRTTWETRERWKAPLEDGPQGGFLNEVRGDGVKATVMLTVPYGSPASSTGHRYRMRASVRISGGPDYAEEFAVGVG